MNKPFRKLECPVKLSGWPKKKLNFIIHIFKNSNEDAAIKSHKNIEPV